MADTIDTSKATLNTRIKTALEELRKLLDTTPSKNLMPIMNDKINKIIYELQSLVARIPAQTTTPTAPTAAAPAKADDAEMKCDEGKPCKIAMCPHCKRKMQYSDGRDAYMCVPCGYVGKNSPMHDHEAPAFWRKNLDYGGK